MILNKSSYERGFAHGQIYKSDVSQTPACSLWILRCHFDCEFESLHEVAHVHVCTCKCTIVHVVIQVQMSTCVDQVIDARDTEDGSKHDRVHMPVVFGVKSGQPVDGLDSDGLPAVGTYLTAGQPYYRYCTCTCTYTPTHSCNTCMYIHAPFRRSTLLHVRVTSTYMYLLVVHVHVYVHHQSAILQVQVVPTVHVFRHLVALN